MAKRRKYEIPGDPELAIHLGYTEERDWTPQRLNKELRLLEEAVESWGELPDKWRHKNRKEWAWMKDTALMVYDCRAAFRARRSKKAIKIYKLIQGRLATNWQTAEGKQPPQKQRPAARKGDQQTSEKAQAKRARVVNLLEDDTKRSPEQIGHMVGLSGPRVRGIKRERRRASKPPMAKKKNKPAKGFPVPMIEVRDSTGALKKTIRTTSLEGFAEEIKNENETYTTKKRQKAGGSKSVSKKRDTRKFRGKTAKQWWESGFKGRVHETDLLVAETCNVKSPRTVENWRVKWKKEGWKQPTKPDIK